MNEKFFIPCTIIESKPYNAEVKAGNFRPFDRTDSIVICSYQFARNKAADVHATPWDMVVIDEARHGGLWPPRRFAKWTDARFCLSPIIKL